MIQKTKTTPGAISRRGWARLSLVCAAALSALAILFAPRDALAGTFEQLPAAARAQLERGEQVVRTRDVEGSKWPAVTVYQLVAAPPEESMAVFSNFGAQASYLHDCCGVLESVVRDSAVGGNPRVQRVFYELQVPVVSNDRYELIETLSKGGDGSYEVSWKKTGKGGHSDDITGRARFEPHGSGTLLIYDNFVKMTALGSGLLSGQSVERTRKTVGAMARHIEQMHAGGGAALAAELARLRAALGG